MKHKIESLKNNTQHANNYIGEQSSNQSQQDTLTFLLEEFDKQKKIIDTQEKLRSKLEKLIDIHEKRIAALENLLSEGFVNSPQEVIMHNALELRTRPILQKSSYKFSANKHLLIWGIVLIIFMGIVWLLEIWL